MNIHLRDTASPAVIAALIGGDDPTLPPIRMRIARHIEEMIDLLDALDGDPDLEPSLGYTPKGYAVDSVDRTTDQTRWAQGRDGDDDDVDREPDVDDEPSLGSTGGTAAGIDWPGGAQAWAGGTTDDREEQCEDEGAR